MATKKTTAARTKAAKANPAAKATAKALVDQVGGDETHTHLANETEEAKMRRKATSPAARKAAVDAGKKDPVEKWGDPKAEPVTGMAIGR